MMGGGEEDGHSEGVEGSRTAERPAHCPETNRKCSPTLHELERRKKGTEL